MRILSGKIKHRTKKAILFVDGTSEISGWIPKSLVYKIEEIGASRSLFGLPPEVTVTMTDKDYKSFGIKFEANDAAPIEI